MKFCKFLDTAYLNIQVTDNLKLLSRITIEVIKIKSTTTHGELFVSK